MRNLHIKDKVWRYKIHSNCVEIRNPEDKKSIVEYRCLNRGNQFKDDYDLIDEYCYDSSICLDEYSLYQHKTNNSYYLSLIHI